MSIYIIRQMRGEELQGLNFDDLQQLEKMLETGLSRVIATKVACLMHKFNLSLWTNMIEKWPFHSGKTDYE